MTHCISPVSCPVITPLLPPGPGNPRNSEGDFMMLNDGRLLFAYSRFQGNLHYDHEPAFLAGRISMDAGATWSGSDHVVMPSDGAMNVMSVSLRRTLEGHLAIFYNCKNSVEDCRMRMRVSMDEGASWGEARLCIPEPGYYPVNNDRVIRLSSGRLLIPASCHGAIVDPFGLPATGNRGDVMSFYSDDDGMTWHRSHNALTAPAGNLNGFQEPGVIELRDGRVMMWIRTDMGSQFLAYSEDGGETWGKATPSAIASPLSPASIKRLPQTGDLMLVWNDHRQIDARRAGKRTPLAIALSTDEGETWRASKVLEDEHLDGYYCYAAIGFVEDRVLLGYCSGDQAKENGGLDQTSLAYFDYQWLYQ